MTHLRGLSILASTNEARLYLALIRTSISVLLIPIIALVGSGEEISIPTNFFTLALNCKSIAFFHTLNTFVLSSSGRLRAVSTRIRLKDVALS